LPPTQVKPRMMAQFNGMIDDNIADGRSSL
jgi:hypothetical protein